MPQSVLYLALVAFWRKGCRIGVRGRRNYCIGNLAIGPCGILSRYPLKDAQIIPRVYPALFRTRMISDFRGASGTPMRRLMSSKTSTDNFCPNTTSNWRAPTPKAFSTQKSCENSSSKGDALPAGRLSRASMGRNSILRWAPRNRRTTRRHARQKGCATLVSAARHCDATTFPGRWSRWHPDRPRAGSPGTD